MAVELHGFSDASQQALGAVIYVRVSDDLDRARVSLVAAKSKVAPIKKVTIPRLELSAVVLLVRLMEQVMNALQLHLSPVHLWVDSTVALIWIRAEPARWREFVANRVAFVRETMPPAGITSPERTILPTTRLAECRPRFSTRRNYGSPVHHG